MSDRPDRPQPLTCEYRCGLRAARSNKMRLSSAYPR